MSQTAAAQSETAPPPHVVTFERSPKRIRVRFNGETIADTVRGLILFERGLIPVYYFPIDDVRMDLLTPTTHSTHCPFKGDASYWTVTVGDRSAENAVWSYPEPIAEVPELKGHVAFYWNKMDQWLEEDEEVFVHARDPHKRIDVVYSERPVQVILGGETVAESRRALFLFETGLPTRYYLPAEDVRRDLLAPTESQSACPYKGTASYWTATVGGTEYADIVWCYRDPLPEVGRVKDYLCFYNENVDEIRIDGEPELKPRTHWSKD